MAEWARGTAEAAAQAGDQATEVQKTIQEIWEEVSKELTPTPESRAEESAIMHGSYARLLLRRAPLVAGVQIAMLFILGWGFLGTMLWGAALMKLDVLTGERSTRFYTVMSLLCYAGGLPLVGFGAYDILVNDFDLIRTLMFTSHFNEIGRVGVTLGHVGLVVVVYKSGLLRPLMHCLGAAGRMALTNYLMQSLICATVFYGWGFGLFGALTRPQLLGVVIAIWSFQLLMSPIWLKFYRFGPAEWLWRTLSYWRYQPMRRS